MDSRPYYVDMLKKCRSCRRHFIFFAAEQQYWYETLKFYIDSECINCPECRQSIRRRKNDWECYSQLASRDELSDEELIHFIELSVDGILERWHDWEPTHDTNTKEQGCSTTARPCHYIGDPGHGQRNPSARPVATQCTKTEPHKA